MNRYLLYLFLSAALSLTSMAQGGQWEWVKGSSTANPAAVYGIKGTPSLNNTPQGLSGSAYWFDLQGNFWIFGGFDGGLNVPCAMWRYSPANNEWTWMSGKDSLQVQGVAGPGAPVYGTRTVASASNFPGARIYSTNWTDNNGNLWLFGGSGWDSTGYPVTYNDLWEYDVSTNLWTWISGSNQANAADVYGSFQQASSTAMPGARYAAGSSWVDANNNLWFFGGVEGNTSFNDMWRYNISTNQWAWMNGPQTGGDAGNYGTIGVENTNNRPPHRTAFCRWKDGSGNFYLWGGGDYWTSNIQHDNKYSDVWKYDVSNNEWAWIAGEDTGGSPGLYNQYCTDNGITGPQARTFNRTAQSLNGGNTFFGYAGYWDRSASPGLDDLWLFNTVTNQWRWIGGKQGTNVAATYGTQGTPSASNLPGSRYNNCMWVDSSGTLWMFGGNASTPYNMFNDVWVYIPDTSCTGTVCTNQGNYQLSTNTICTGGQAALSLSNLANAAITPAASVTWQDTVHALLHPGITTTYIVTGRSGCGNNDTLSFTIQVSPVSVQASSSNPVFCPGDSTSICATAGFQTYQWNTGDTGMCMEVKITGSYYVSATAVSGCTATSSPVSISNYPTTPVTISLNGDTLTSYGAVAYQWQVNGQPIPGATSGIFVATAPGNYIVEITDTNGCHYSSSAVFIATANTDIQTGPEIMVFPNPLSGGSLYLNVSENLIGSWCELFDAAGGSVLHFEIRNPHSEILPDLAAGIYMMQVRSQTANYTFKLVKLR